MTRDAHFKLDNPFVVKSPEELTADQVQALFVSQYTRLETILERRHTFVWGTRGSGKSILLRYLEPHCQALVHSSLKRFLKSDAAFLGVLCPCKEGRINKTELSLLAPLASSVLTEHLLNLSISESVVSCLDFLLAQAAITQQEARSFVDEAVRLFDKASIATSIQDLNGKLTREQDPLGWLQKLLESEHRRISIFLRDSVLQGDFARYTGATSGYHDYLRPFLHCCQGFEALRQVPIYLLLDDADRLTPEQQEIVNTWVANRDQQIVCLKIAAQRDRFSTFRTKEGGIIEQPHDYSEVSFDELYTHSKSTYSKKIRLIANRRLGLSTVPSNDIEEFLPADEREAELLAQIRESLKDEWVEKGKPGRQQDYVNRYSVARLFQQLSREKKRKSYAGFQNSVDLSSGGVRDFLEPCYLMVDEYSKRGTPHTEMESIPTSIQDEVLFRYSEEFILEHFDDIRKGLSPEEWSDVEALATLVASLGQLFYERLHDPDAREARLFSFTVRGRIPDDIRRILQLGVRFRYFQLRSYSRKEGGGREEWYVLNRRLCPVFKLDPTGFEGRISLTTEFLRLACESPTKFVRLRLKKRPTRSELPLFELER